MTNSKLNTILSILKKMDIDKENLDIRTINLVSILDKYTDSELIKINDMIDNFISVFGVDMLEDTLKNKIMWI